MIQVSTMHVAMAVKNVIFSQHLLVIQNCSYYYLLRINQMECLFNWLTVSELGVFIYLLCMYTILVLEVKVIFAFVKQLNGFAVRICSIQIPYWMKMISRSRIHCLWKVSFVWILSGIWWKLQYCTNVKRWVERRDKRNKEKLHTYFSYVFGMIIQVRVVFRKTIVGDWRFDCLSVSRFQSQSFTMILI